MSCSGGNRRPSHSVSLFKSPFVRAFAFLTALLVVASMSFFPQVLAAPTYYVTISARYSGTSTGVSVPITEDGISTGFNTPHVFTVTGEHNFSVPYSDAGGHPFSTWSANAPSDPSFTTISVSSGGSYWAFYDTHVPRSSVGPNDYVFPAESRYYVTPSDPAVAAAAAGKSWSDIINWVSSRITYNASLNIWQFPNETLVIGSGECREFSTLAVSMLLARGYSAYVVIGNATDVNGGSIGHAWILVELNGTFYHFEPQRSWANQPSSGNFSQYIPEYYVDNIGLYPAGSSLDPPQAQTYDVTINTSLNNVTNSVQVAIIEDGTPTGFDTPHSFVGLSGVHNFTVPYLDEAGHPFTSWGNNFAGEKIFPTIATSSGGSFTAFYHASMDFGRLYPAEKILLITPSDPAVIAVASNKSWNEIFDYTSSIPWANNTAAQFPNQTIANGSRLYLDAASLACSMLRARGYTAYLVGGSSPSTDSWIVLSLNGTTFQLDPKYSSREQQSANFTDYRANYYVDENGIYPPGITQSPPPYPSSDPNLTPSPTSVSTPQTTLEPTQSPPVPEFSLFLSLLAIALASIVLAVFVNRKSSLKPKIDWPLSA